MTQEGLFSAGPSSANLTIYNVILLLEFVDVYNLAQLAPCNAIESATCLTPSTEFRRAEPISDDVRLRLGMMRIVTSLLPILVLEGLLGAMFLGVSPGTSGSERGFDVGVSRGHVVNYP